MLTLHLKECQNWINEIIARRQKGIFVEEDDSITMIDLLLEAKPEGKLPKMEELIDEAFVFLTAGVHTTAYTLAHATYYLLSNGDALEKLRAELADVPRDLKGNFKWKHLSILPYLVCQPPKLSRAATETARG